MTRADTLFEQIMELSAEEREALMERVQVERPETALHPDWNAELKRRLAAHDRGESKSQSSEEVHQELRERLRARRG